MIYHEFDPYGNPVNNAEEGEPYGYTGEWYEGYINLLHLRARWYAPSEGVFLSRDPVEGSELQPATLHKYNYAKNNPVNNLDPTGLQTEPNGHDPYDPAWCDSWWYPQRLSCDQITSPLIPEPLRWAEMYDVYTRIMAAQELYGYKVGGKLWRNFLLSGGDLSIEGSWLSDWFRTSSKFIEWHNQQMNDFLRMAVVPAIETCSTETVIKWKAARAGHETGSPKAVELSKEIGLYSVIDIKGLRDSEVSFTLGKYYLEGDFKAENFRKNGSIVTADVTINRFVNDIFDFRNDFGGIPMHQLFPSFPNPGFGHVPNVWAQTLEQNGLAKYFDLHMKWVEKTKLEINQ